MDDKVRENLLQANSEEEILRIIDNAMTKRLKKKKKAQEQEVKHKQQLVHHE